MKVGIIIVNFNTKDLLRNCLNSILNKKWKHQYEIWVVDNGSKDGSLELIRSKFPQLNLVDVGNNVGFTTGNNLGLKQSKLGLNILLNSDTEVYENSLDNLVDFINDSVFGIGSCKLVYKDGTFQPNAGLLPTPPPLLVWVSGLDDILPIIGKNLPTTHFKDGFLKGQKEVGWVSGSVMIIKREVIEKIDGLDENIFMYGEDMEFCLRAKKAGFKIGWTDTAVIMHIGGGSSRNSSLRQWLGELKGLLYIYKKFHGQLAATGLKLLLYFFILLRILAFSIVGKFNIALTYGKVLTSL